MINVVENPYRCMEVETNNGVVTISEGTKIKFCTEAGVDIRGTLLKIKGKGEKIKLEILPVNSDHQETWESAVIAAGSLNLDTRDDINE